MSGTGSTPSAARGERRLEDEAAEVGARLDGDRDVLLARQPADLHERARDQLAQLGARVGRLHQRRADENRVRAGELRRRALGARVDRALGDDHAVSRRTRDELELRSAVDRERREIARVDPDHGSAERDGPPELGLVVRLDERVEADPVRVPHQRCRRGVVEVAQDQQRGVRTRLAELAQVLLGREEPLARSGTVVADLAAARSATVPAKRSSTSTETALAPCAA